MELPVPVHVTPLKGWRFRPMDDDLVGYYLLRKVTGCPFPYVGIVHDFDVFGKKEPWEIWSTFRSENDDNNPDPDDLYFFTKPKKSTPKGKRFNRKVGSGTWKGQDSGTEIYASSADNNEIVIGFKKRFHYENKQSNEHDGSWIMFEYCLAGSLSHCITGSDNDFVLCRIRKKSSSENKNKRKNSMIISCDDDFVLPLIKNQKTNTNNGNNTGCSSYVDHDTAPFGPPQPPFPMPCPQQPCLAESSLPLIPQSSLPLPPPGDGFDMLLPQQPLPVPIDDDFIIDFKALDGFEL